MAPDCSDRCLWRCPAMHLQRPSPFALLPRELADPGYTLTAALAKGNLPKGSIRGNTMGVGRLIILGCWLGLAAAASGCASIVEGTDQSVTVQTTPSGASCELKRDGSVIGVINPTPGTVTVDKSKDDIAVICKKEGYQDTSGAFSSDRQGMTFGNILFGGLIGVAVDASSGAMHEYPASVSIAMAPNSFPNTLERDKFFDQRADSIRKDAEAAIAKVRQDCKSSQQKTCDEAVGKIETARDSQLADVEV